MVNGRSRDEIISNILEICMSGAIKTMIVHQANLNFTMVEPYIFMLTKSGMIDAGDGSRVIYHTTPKGMELLEDYKRIEVELIGRH